jgi:hypothetical protein
MANNLERLDTATVWDFRLCPKLFVYTESVDGRGQMLGGY